MLDASAPDQATYKYIISGMGGFIMIAGYGAVSWIKAILQELREERTGRLNDLKEQFKSVKNS